MTIFNGDRHELGAYVREMADLMGLRDWTIVMKHGDPDNPDSGADIEVTYGQKVADIRFRSGWEDFPIEDLRWLVTHELVHCHLWTMNQRVCDLHDIIGQAVYEVTSKAHRDALEHAVDGIARAWMERLPLPVKRKAGRKAA